MILGTGLGLILTKRSTLNDLELLRLNFETLLSLVNHN